MQIRRPTTALLALSLAGSLAACGGGGGFEDDEAAGSGGDGGGGGGALQLLIAPSGDAETDFVTGAAAAWSEESGTEVEVLPATDIAQQLAQGFAGGSPPDVFYVDAAAFADLAAAGNLHPYADQAEDLDDFYEPLRESFTYDGTAYCLPKDFATLALAIREDAWSEAGLTDADVPTTWDELQQVAGTLTTGDQVGLGLGDTKDRIGAFMVEAGGWFLADDGTPSAMSPENVEALTYVKGLLDEGVASYPSALDAGWSGEAFGTGRAAMVVEGNWLAGALANDYPDVEYRVVEMPEGPQGPGTLQFTQCYGVAADSDQQEAAVDLALHLTAPEQMVTASEAFGVMPARASLADEYTETYPDRAAFVAGAEYSQGPVNAEGVTSVMDDFDSRLQQLSTSDPEQILSELQSNLEAAAG